MNVIRKIIRPQTCQYIFPRFRSSDIYEPPYLSEMVSKIPLYDQLNIVFRGYDYPVLENYQKFVHKLLKNMDVEVEDCWGLPAQQMQVTKLKPRSDIVESQFHLKLYQRVIQIVDVKSTVLPMVIRAVEASLPPGVKLEIKHHEEADEETRYIPDRELNTLKDELDALGGPLKKK